MTREAGESDFDFIYYLYMHPDTNPHLLYENMDKDQFKPIFDNLINQNLIHIFSVDGLAVGMFKLVPLFHRADHINYLGGLAIDPAHSGKGFGSEMIKQIIEVCQNRNLKRIELSAGSANQKAINLYLKHGFEKEGVLRNYTHLKSESKYIDEVMMSYLF